VAAMTTVISLGGDDDDIGVDDESAGNEDAELMGSKAVLPPLIGSVLLLL